MSMEGTTNHIVVACLLDTGCLFDNFIKEDIARRLGTSTQSADRQRLATLADGSITSSVGYVVCDVTLKHDKISMKLKDVKLHILPSGLIVRCYIRISLYKEEQPSTYIVLSFQREQLAGAQLH